MLPAEFETDLQRLYDDVVDGRTDIPWLRAELDRLTAARDRLELERPARADWILRLLRDQLAADEADEAWTVDGEEHPVAQAIRIRATAGLDTTGAERIAELHEGIAEIHELAGTVDDQYVARVVRQEAWLIHQQILALQTTGGGTDGP